MPIRNIFAAILAISTSALPLSSAFSQQLNDDPMLAAPEEERATEKAAADEIYLSTLGGQVLRFNVKTGGLRQVASTFVALTDIAMCPDRRLYGISFYNLYRIDLRKQSASLIGEHDVTGLNALVCDKENRLLGHSGSGTTLYRIDRDTAAATALGKTGAFRSSGDLEFLGAELLLSTINSRLVRLNPASGKVQRIARTGSKFVYGLAAVGKTLYGFVGTDAYTIDPKSGKRTLLKSLGTSIGAISGATAAVVD